MFEVLSVTGTVFALIAIGYFATRARFFTATDHEVLTKFVMRLALPALIFRSVSTRSVSEIFDPAFLLAYGGGSVLTFFVMLSVARRLFRRDALDGTLIGIGTSACNTGFVGYPVVLVAFPDVAGRILALCMLVENLIIMPLGIAMLEQAQGRGESARSFARKIFRRMATNPIMISLVVSLAVSLSGLTVPHAILNPVSLIAQAAAAPALLVIGGTLVGLSFRGINAYVVAAVAGKLLLHPLVVMVAALAVTSVGFEFHEATLSRAAVLAAAVPAFTLYPLFARSYGRPQEAALAHSLMTMLSFVSLTAVLVLV
ncbi:putative transporter YfdV [Aquimixticola soesokkakensis]|uniref:Putative transporter YfdV n=1 Tax=Aquimixticola soesokkakensis TaxID=1519096 RepID=A0A1Y5TS86_9RHOB|nr:AEC family transporter [Aquimixticola soesokkakensis]SLN66999.1 putative transporter YfdV [Aquimixticola soesokkakensis]